MQFNQCFGSQFAADVIELKAPVGATLSFEAIKASVELNKPAVLFLCQVQSWHKPSPSLGQGLCSPSCEMCCPSTFLSPIQFAARPHTLETRLCQANLLFACCCFASAPPKQRNMFSFLSLLHTPASKLESSRPVCKPDPDPDISLCSRAWDVRLLRVVAAPKPGLKPFLRCAFSRGASSTGLVQLKNHPYQEPTVFD